MTSARSALLAAGLAVASPAAAQQAACMSQDEVRQAVGAGQAVAPAAASRAARDVAPGELLRVRLCRESERLIYHVTTLRRDGRVAHVTIDGASGNVAAVR